MVFLGDFFKRLCQLFGKEVTKEVVRFLNDGADYRDWNRTLIPKKNKSTGVILNRLRRFQPATKRRRTTYVALKLNISKAYES